MKKAIVTGAGGFIGGALTKKLLSMGVMVYGLDISKERLAQVSTADNFKPIVADFSVYKNLAKMIGDSEIDAFYHFAWQGICGEEFKNYELQLDNAKYACDALMAAAELKCRKFVFAGSYNEFEVKSFMNSDSLFSPRYNCIYSMSKLAAEIICKTLSFYNNIDCCAGLICMAYGEGNRSRMLPNVIIKNLLNGQSPKLIEGNNDYDMVYIGDIVDAFVSIAEKGVNQRSYYIGHRKPAKFRTLMEEIRNVINPDVELLFGAYKDTSNVDYSLVDLDALYNDTGFECKADFRDSILKTAEWVKTLDI